MGDLGYPSKYLENYAILIGTNMGILLPHIKRVLGTNQYEKSGVQTSQEKMGLGNNQDNIGYYVWAV